MGYRWCKSGAVSLSSEWEEVSDLNIWISVKVWPIFGGGEDLNAGEIDKMNKNVDDILLHSDQRSDT